MISHVHVGVNEFGAAMRFYQAVLPELGLAIKFSDAERQWAGWMKPGVPRPLFVIGTPHDGAPAAVGNGHMVALLAPTRAAVDRFYHVALEAGATCEGPPGLRPHYHADYYGAYVRDPEGNKIAVCCHDPVAA